MVHNANTACAALMEQDAPKSAPVLLDGHDLHKTLQWYPPPYRCYSRRELLADRCVNFAGAALSWVGTVWLVHVSHSAGNSVLKQFGFCVFGLGLVTMLNCSALYHHWAWHWEAQRKLLALDHVGINAMIACSYAPFMLQCGCYRTLSFVWILALLGLIMEAWQLAQGELIMSRFFRMAHVVRYLIMGWTVVVVLPTALQYIQTVAFMVSLVGGLLYSGGIAVFLQQHMEFHLPLWHIFVFCASSCFYLVNLLYLVNGPPLGVPLSSWAATH